MELIMVIFAAILGAALGSFACCQAWRLHYSLQKKKPLGHFSVCLHCKKKLAWYDKIPIFSWLFLRGRCRHCHKKIGRVEITTEISGALAAVILVIIYLAPIFYTTYNLPVIILQVILSLLSLFLMTILIILAVYDSKWGELPSKLLYLAVFSAVLIFILTELSHLFSGTFAFAELLSTVGSIAIFAAPCFVLYKMSDETLMGGGDWWLALSLSFLLANWWLALWAMTFACLFASVISSPAVIKENRRTLHFAPYLIAGTFASLACQFILLELI